MEIGSEEQKKLIEYEFKFIELVAQQLDPPLIITKVIVASDFDRAVNAIEGNNNFKSSRGTESHGISTSAKICKDGDGYTIVVSPIFYIDPFDNIIRFFVFNHELVHIINRRDFPPLPDDSYVRNLYAANIYALYDEYYADRLAFDITDNVYPEKSQQWTDWVKSEIEGFIELVNDLSYYDTFREEIKSFRSHADVDLFLRNIRPSYDVVSTVLSHLFAEYHRYPEFVSSADLLKSPFVNEKTFALADYFKKKFEESSIELLDGLDIVREFMTNFGVKFEHRDYGSYCYVLDI